MTTYAGWWEVPDHLLPATALGELEYPRTSDGQPVTAWVDTRDWSDRKTSIPLYDARGCPATKATAAQLQAAAARSGRQRRCADCDARCQRPLPPLDPDDPRPLCPACRHVALLRRRQADLAADRLVGPRAHYVPDGAVGPQATAPTIHRALVGRRLLLWSHQDLTNLHTAAPHDAPPDIGDLAWSSTHHGTGEPHHPVRDRAAAVQYLATHWRGQLHPHTRTLVECLAPGTPGRLLLMLRRIAAAPVGSQGR